VRGLLLLVAACGPGIQEQHANPGAPLIAASGDPAAFAKLLRGSVMNGGVWFEDPACTRQFPAPGKIEGDRLDAFAKCLAALHLEATPRNDTYPDGTVLTYRAGFELEALVDEDLDGPRLYWIGYSARHDTADALPTITPQTLESLRIAGDRNGPIDPAASRGWPELQLGAKSSAYAWLKICIDRDGLVTSTHSREASSLEASNAFKSAVASWRFRPFVVGTQALPVCAMVHLQYPTTNAEPETLPPATEDEVLTLPARAVEAHRISGEKMIVPNDAIRRAIAKLHIGRVIGSFKLCLDESGHVSKIDTLRSTRIASYDERLKAAISAWVYSPFLYEGQPRPVCTAVTFIYSQR
jgi:hypothetical protein